MRLGTLLRLILGNAIYYTPLARTYFYRYRYNFAPAQLSYLCDAIGRTKDLTGPILEVGCANGHTTVFLNKHLDFLGIEKPYIALDTFSGFSSSDVDYEIQDRGKRSRKSYEGFRVNSERWFNKTMRHHRITRVRSIKADVTIFQFDPEDRFSFCLLDVDLYRPTIVALEKVYPLMNQGGIIVVDDCMPNRRFDGAYAAYKEFIKRFNLEEKIVLRKLGVIEIPRTLLSNLP